MHKKVGGCGMEVGISRWFTDSMIYWFTDEFYMQLSGQCKGYDIPLTSDFFISFLILNCQLSIIHYFPDLISSSGHPICAESVPSGKRQAVWAAVRRRVICLLANKQLSGRWGDAVLIFFCILFCIKAKKYVGFGAKPQEWMDNG